MRKRIARAVGAVLLATSWLAIDVAAAEPQINMLHQWYRGSDAAAIAKLGEMFTAAGGKWEQTAIAGHTANTIAKLRADVIAGNAPPAVQLKGPEIAEWVATGLTANLNDVAAAENWDKVVAPQLIKVMKPEDVWVAAPMNIHRVNWMWGSKKAMDKAGVKEMPRTWDEFNAAAEKMKAAGIYPVAHSSQDWIDATLLDDIVYGIPPLLRKHNLTYRTNNIMGSPAETLDDMFETVRVNKRIKPHGCTVLIYRAFKSTVLGLEDYEKGRVDLEKDIGPSIQNDSHMRRDDVAQKSRPRAFAGRGIS